MKEIVLPKGYVALVDDEDFEYLNEYSWHLYVGRRGERRVCRSINSILNGKKKCTTISMHRQIMNCTKGDGKIIDHADRNPLNNQRHNLRFATRAQNRANSKAWGASKYLGVCISKPKITLKDGSIKIYPIKWVASIRVNKKLKSIGIFKTQEEAALAYNKEAIKYHGEFARLNEI